MTPGCPRTPVLSVAPARCPPFPHRGPRARQPRRTDRRGHDVVRAHRAAEAHREMDRVRDKGLRPVWRDVRASDAYGKPCGLPGAAVVHLRLRACGSTGAIRRIAPANDRCVSHLWAAVLRRQAKSPSKTPILFEVMRESLASRATRENRATKNLRGVRFDVDGAADEQDVLR